MYSDILVIKLNIIAHQHAEIIRRAITDILNQPKYRNTGAGVQSLKVEVIEGDASKSPQLRITMDDHLLIIDKKRMQWTKLPEVKRLTAWAETKSQDPAEIKKLVWSTAWKQKKYDAWKPKQWRKKALGPALKEMNKKLVMAFEQAIEEDMQKAAA